MRLKAKAAYGDDDASPSNTGMCSDFYVFKWVLTKPACVGDVLESWDSSLASAVAVQPRSWSSQLASILARSTPPRAGSIGARRADSASLMAVS
jgi:hypothetical protein